MKRLVRWTGLFCFNWIASSLKLQAASVASSFKFQAARLETFFFLKNYLFPLPPAHSGKNFRKPQGVCKFLPLLSIILINFKPSGEFSLMGKFKGVMF